MVRRLTEGLNSKKEFEQFANYVYLECQKAGFMPHIFLDTRDKYDPDNHHKGEYNGYNASISLYTNESNYKKVLGKEYGIIYLWYGYDDTEYIDEPYIAIMFNYGSHRFGDDVDIDKTCESYSEAKMYVKELISTLKIQASQYLYNANECIKKYNKTTAESKSRTRKRSIEEGVRKPQYYDPELEQFEISFITHGKDGQDEIRDYVDSRRDTGIFGSIGSEYNNISVWVNTEDIDDTFVNEVEDLIIFAQDCGARINLACYNQLKDLFTIKHAPYDI